ncbi:hypothetical protein DKX38_003738 [Salix brachista]|uniref:Uncharacterized protein n=1 Tax=Salix brachista TaxID=2182728 RepID=A0A5N5N8N8_9ROSI|nr:hypothetical protein DKX38_003738 [Salix brachista]
MGVFTFVCRSSGHEWNAKQISDGDIEASGSSTFELQRKLVQSALSADSSGAVQSSFAYVTPSSAVFQQVLFPTIVLNGLLSMMLLGSCRVVHAGSSPVMHFQMGSVDSSEYLLDCDFNSLTEQASDVSIFTFPPHSRGATLFA